MMSMGSHILLVCVTMTLTSNEGSCGDLVRRVIANKPANSNSEFANYSSINQQSQQCSTSGQYVQQQQLNNSKDGGILCENSTNSSSVCDNKDSTACDKYFVQVWGRFLMIL